MKNYPIELTDEQKRFISCHTKMSSYAIQQYLRVPLSAVEHYRKQLQKAA